MKLVENWSEIFRWNTKGGIVGRLSDQSVHVPTKPNEQIVDFGVDYVQASIAYLRNNQITTNRYEDHDLMDDYPLINNALDLISSEATQLNQEDTVIQVKCNSEIDTDDEKAMGELEALNKYKEHFMRGFTGGASLSSLFRKYAKNGDTVLVPVYNDDKSKVLKYVYVPPANIKLVINTDTFSIVKYIVTPDEGSDSTYGINSYVKAAEYDPDEVYHMSLNPETSDFYPYGMSVLDSVANTYRKLRLMEDAMIVYRISRAPERLIFKVDVGEMSPAKAEKYLNDIKNKLIRKDFYDPTSGQIDSEYNPLTAMENFFIPTRPGGADVEIDQLPGACLAMDTKVPLLDGRTLTIREIAAEYESEKELWVYSCDPDNGEIVPGIISWAGVTKKSSKVVKITLDNGGEIICTPDHKFPVIGKGFVEAKDLANNESMIPFNTRNEKISSVEYLPDEIEVGTLTIDAGEKYHNHHTFALDSGIFTKNSNLDQVGDLEYLRGVLVHGLKVPASYLRNDDPGTFNDGRVGIAYIQEIRFANFIESLQHSFAMQIEKYFRKYLKRRDVNFDIKFTLSMTPPSNYKEYKENELAVSNISNYTSLSGAADSDGNPIFSEEMLMGKYLGWSPEDIAKNREFLEEIKEEKDAEEPDLPPEDELGGELEGESPVDVPSEELP